MIVADFRILWNTTLKEPAFNCSFVHKGSVLPQYSYWITPVLLLDYSSTSIEVLQYSLLDYSSTSIELLQYSYWITPVLALDMTPVLALGFSISSRLALLNLQKSSVICLPSFCSFINLFQKFPVSCIFKDSHLLDSNLIEFDESFRLCHTIVDKHCIEILHIR